HRRAALERLRDADRRHGEGRGRRDRACARSGRDAAAGRNGSGGGARLAPPPRADATAMHLLCSLINGAAVTGGSVGADKSRLDFDLATPPRNDNIEADLNALIAA